MKFSGKKARKWAVATWWTAAAPLLLILFLISLCASGPLADNGQSAYKAKCAICHGADGSGNTAMGKKMKIRDLRSPDVQNQSDALLSDIIARGKGKMPGFEKSLGRDKIREVVAYIRELGKKH